MNMIFDWTVEKLQDESGRREFSQQASAYIRDAVRKISIMDQVIPPELVGEGERIRGLGDTVLIKKDIRMDGTTMLIHARRAYFPECRGIFHIYSYEYRFYRGR